MGYAHQANIANGPQQVNYENGPAVWDSSNTINRYRKTVSSQGTGACNERNFSI